LFFAKVDVSACFDTIPQEGVIELVAELLSTEHYQVEQHALIKGSQGLQPGDGFAKIPPRVKFYSEGRSAGGLTGEPSNEHKSNSGCGNCVLVGPLAQQSLRKQQVLTLLKEHVERNLVKLGKKYYRQRNGIPQGSILSSLLCNFFYGKLEQELMTWNDSCIMLRLIDDFLLITTDRQHAESFLRLLHKGIPTYGVSIKPEKSLVNFDMNIDGRSVPKTATPYFPYCGLLIDQGSLNIKRDMEKQLGVKMADSLTVEYSTLPGRTFHRKALNAFKIKFHAMFVDTGFNSLRTAAENLYRSFHEAASRMLHYLRCLPSASHTSEPMIISKVSSPDLAFASLLIRYACRHDREPHKTGVEADAAEADCRQHKLSLLGAPEPGEMVSVSVPRFNVVGAKRRTLDFCWPSGDALTPDRYRLACKAFGEVFRSHQSGLGVLLDWLALNLDRTWPSSAKEACLLQRLMRDASSRHGA